jgi:transposase
VEWPDEGTYSRLPPMIDAAHTVKRRWDGILRWFHSKIANGLIEGINSLVQAAKFKARGSGQCATSGPCSTCWQAS